MKKVQELTKKHLKTVHMMQIATLSDKQPWCCTVYFVPDEELNLYWISKPDRRHSEEIHKHQEVAAAIPIKHVPGKAVVGISLEGDAFLVKDDTKEVKMAARLYADRYKTGEKWYRNFIAGKNPHKLYRLSPRLMVLFDEEAFPKNPRQEWKLK